MDQVKFVEYNLKKFEAIIMVFVNRPSHFDFLKALFCKFLFGPFSNTLSPLILPLKLFDFISN